MADPPLEPVTAPEAPRLRRRLGLLHATALNMANMVGVGPFLTIPSIVAAISGPQVIVGWFLGLVLAVADSMMWCELGAALPGSGGTYHYLREVFRGRPAGRLLPFLFIWQFIFSGPLEVASGCIGFSSYLDVLWPARWGALTEVVVEKRMEDGKEKTDEKSILTFKGKLAASGVAGLAVVLLYRRIGSIGKLTIALWVGMLLSVGAVIVTAASGFSPGRAFTFPPQAFQGGFGTALGAALAIAMYDFLGYYDICYLGDEVREPGRTIPRAVIISVFAVASIYMVMNIGILGAMPLEKVISSKAIAADLAKAVWRSDWAMNGFTVLILWTAFASIFALLLGYSRIPFAAARDGYFFAPFKDLHPKKEFPRLSLLVLGAVTVAASWFNFMTVLTALLTSRIIAQFVVQIGAVIALRRLRPDVPMPFKMWLYPLPCLFALAGWTFIFATSGIEPIFYGLGTLALGVLAFFLIFRPRRE